MPSQITESFVPIAAGILVSLINKHMLNNPSIGHCCQHETEEEDVESETSNQTDMSDALSGASANTTSTLTPPHPMHYHHTHHEFQMRMLIVFSNFSVNFPNLKHMKVLTASRFKSGVIYRL